MNKKLLLHNKKVVRLFPVFGECEVLRCFHVWFSNSTTGNWVAGAAASYFTSVHCSQTTSCSWRKLFLENSVRLHTHRWEPEFESFYQHKKWRHTSMALRWVLVYCCRLAVAAAFCIFRNNSKSIFKPPTTALLEGGGEKPCWCKWSAGGGESRSQAQFPWCHVWCWETWETEISAYATIWVRNSHIHKKNWRHRIIAVSRFWLKFVKD